MKYQWIHLALSQQLEERLPAIAEFGDDYEMFMAWLRFTSVKPIFAEPAVPNRDMLLAHTRFQELSPRGTEMSDFKLALQRNESA